jgi:hypothetical protein
MTAEPQDTPPTADLQADTLRLLELFGRVDLAQIAEIDSAFDDWSQARVEQCLAYATRCVTDPAKIGQERAVAEAKTALSDLKTAWTGFTDALKGFNTQ